MKVRWNAIAAAACALLAAGPVMAQDPPGKPPQQPPPPAGRQDADKKLEQRDEAVGRVWRATKLIGCKVKDAKGEKIGDIDDLIIDKDEGRVAYTILSFGGFLNIGEKLFAVPFATLTRTKDDDVVVLDITKERLEKAPSFAKNTWPEFNRDYGTSVHEYYKTPPYWTDRYHLDRGDVARVDKEALDKGRLKARGMCRASKTIGTNVEDAEGKNLGDIDDLAIDDASGRVVYAVLSFGGFLGMGDKLFAIPWDAFKPSAKDQDKLVLDVPKDKLKSAPGFDKKNWPNMADRRWGLEMHRYYDQKPYWEYETKKSGSSN